jgi:hypothetical protein
MQREFTGGDVRDGGSFMHSVVERAFADAA